MPDKKSLENIYWKMSEVCSRTECLIREIGPHKDIRESVGELYDSLLKAFEKVKADCDFVEIVYKEKDGKNEKYNKSKN